MLYNMFFFLRMLYFLCNFAYPKKESTTFFLPSWFAPWRRLPGLKHSHNMYPVQILIQWRDGSLSSQVMFVRSALSARSEVLERFGWSSSIVGLLAYLDGSCVVSWEGGAA